MKKFPLPFLIILFALLSLLASCQNIQIHQNSSQSLGSSEKQSTVSRIEEPKKPQFALNPLTGISDLDPKTEDNRPVAIMINNIKTAWSVQTGLCKADIVYETYVEGGITRLLALYKDYAKIPEIGTIRSARYTYAELAKGHDAIYISAGADKTYYRPYYKQIGLDWYDLGARKGGYRIKNGKAYEHTLYTSGERLQNGFEAYKSLRKKVSSKTAGQAFDFLSADSKASMDGGNCTSLKVMFSANYISGYDYNGKTGLYLKTQGGLPHTDYKTKKQIAVTNIFVLFSDVTKFPDNVHVKTDLSGGGGYYFSKGIYKEISWSKKSPDSLLIFTDKNGKSLKVTPGNSWVCLVDKKMQSNLIIKDDFKDNGAESSQ